MATLDLSKLKDDLLRDKNQLRPILTSLNGDNSWLFSFPRPAAERASTGKVYYHVASDPYLKNPAIVAYTWLLTMELQIPPIVHDGDGVANLVRQIEETAAAAGVVDSTQPLSAPAVDAICVHMSSPDHVHKATLSTFPRSTPVFATPESAPKVKALGHFENVVTMKQPGADTADWRSLHAGTPLPPWLTVFPLTVEQQNFSWAMIYTGGTDGAAEAIVTAPHGLKGDYPTMDLIKDASVLAMLFPTKDSFTFGFQTVFGKTHGLHAYQQLAPKYWVPTHGARFDYWGLIQVTDVRHDEWALEQQRCMDEKSPNLVEVGNGHSLMLV